jgi:hypothetical protein
LSRLVPLPQDFILGLEFLHFVDVFFAELSAGSN